METPIESAKRHWYSIKEAAEYLDVGEPTIYRWMRDKRITYRKVGDSTRFWKEDLDAVMQVHHADRDLDQVKTVCPACHHDELVEGRVESTGLNYFRPKETKFWTFKTSNIDTEARMCARCGAVIWFADLAALSVLKRHGSLEELGRKPQPSTQREAGEEKS